jgi:probable phosphoglycerate mutase
MREVILARHGESEYSVKHLMNGDPVTVVRLTDAGREQARLLGEALRDEEVDLCVTSEFGRTIETADIALEGRDVPRLVLRDLNDIRVGEYEGKTLQEYRDWAHAQSPTALPPGGDESRAATVQRYVRAFREIMDRDERVILVVAHGLPIRYILNAAEGTHPAPIVEQIEYATAYRLDRDTLETAIDALDTWGANPSWATSPSP